MFCSNCGKKVFEQAKFCKFCGFQVNMIETINSIAETTEFQVTKKFEMNREALILYLQNVRDLEVARNILMRNHKQKQSEYNNKCDYCEREVIFKEYPVKPTKEEYSVGICMLIFGICIFGTINFMNSLLAVDSMLSGVFNFLAIVLVIVGIVSIITVSSKNKEIQSGYEYRCDEIDKENEKAVSEAKERQQQITALNKEWNSECEEFERNIKDVEKILSSFYDMNIIANEYRYNLPAVQYIYEVASSTQLSYEQICLQTKVEDGIRRIETNLNEIINQVEELIYQTRCMREEQNSAIQNMIKQNNDMLFHLEQASQNSALSAQYAQLASNYAEANAYFSLATYLKTPN